MKLVLSLLLSVAAASPLDLGSGGVYDSPAATDFYVRQFGFMFGGGRSGVLGLKAMQENVERFHRLNLPAVPSLRPEESRVGSNEKNMVELDPLMMETSKSGSSSSPKMFHRFMAVP